MGENVLFLLLAYIFVNFMTLLLHIHLSFCSIFEGVGGYRLVTPDLAPYATFFFIFTKLKKSSYSVVVTSPNKHLTLPSLLSQMFIPISFHDAFRTGCKIISCAAMLRCHELKYDWIQLIFFLINEKNALTGIISWSFLNICWQQCWTLFLMPFCDVICTSMSHDMCILTLQTI